MIISHKYKFIFLKTRKTAGTSIEIALSRFCEEKDIITHISAKDEPIREELGSLSPQNYYVPLARYTLKDWQRLIIRRRRKKFYNHIPALQVQQYLKRNTWDNYFKFCFERNPWDKAISLYYWQTRNQESTPSLTEHLKSIDIDRLSNFHIYSINEKIAVDHVGLYENLENELEKIAERLKLPEKLILPKAKGDARKNRQHYRDIMDEETRYLVEKVCAKEISYFGYRY